MNDRARVFLSGVAALALLLCAGCERLEGSKPAPPSTSAHEDLLMGYDLLADTLSDESQLRMLKLFKKITFRGAVDEVNDTMDVLGKASRQRSKELKELRKLAPDVSGKPATRSPIGDAITAAAKSEGKDEMMGDSAFDLRFMLLQAQATRMVGAMATAIAKYEPNAERKKWLTEVASEYEGYRDDIVEVIRKYIQGQGAAQQQG